MTSPVGDLVRMYLLPGSVGLLDLDFHVALFILIV